MPAYLRGLVEDNRFVEVLPLAIRNKAKVASHDLIPLKFSSGGSGRGGVSVFESQILSVAPRPIVKRVEAGP